jgi:hypothetical protein
MRVVVTLALLLMIAALPTTAEAGNGHGHGITRHGHGTTAHRFHHLRMNHVRGPRFVSFIPADFFDAGGEHFIAGAMPEPVMLAPPPPLPPRHHDDRPTVEHTDVGVTIIRGPSLR